MKLRFLFIIFALVKGLCLNAQVGINTTTPTAMLDVNGSVKIDQKLFLEDPGNSNQIRGSKLLIERTDKSIVQYDIQVSKYGPINYAELLFSNTSKYGVRDYNTKISIEDYIVTVQGYYFVEHGTGNTSVVTQSSSGNDYVEGYQVYAYKNTTTKTWYIRGFINNNGIFRTSNNDNISIDLHMNLIIFRTGLLTKKEIPTYSVRAYKYESGTIPKPAGF